MHDRNSRQTQCMGYLCLAKARGVVLKREPPAGFVNVESAQAVGVGEFAETLELLVAQGRLQFISDFEKGHGVKYSRSGPSLSSRQSSGKRLPSRRDLRWEIETRNSSELPAGALTEYRGKGYKYPIGVY